MYRLLKERGDAPVTMQNTDTGANIIIGKVSIDLLHTLETDEGYSTTADDPEKRIGLNDKWDLKVSEDTAKLLARKTMPMKKPVRIKKEASTEQKTETKSKKQPVDVFNLIFGVED